MTVLLAAASAAPAYVPSLVWIWPFVAILLAIAILPLLPATRHWWEHNQSKLLISVILALVTLVYYYTRETGFPVHATHAAGAEEHAVADAAHAPDAVAAVDGAGPGVPTTAAVDTHAASGDEAGHAAAAAHAVHRTDRGWPTVSAVLHHAVLAEYVPFIVLLFSLYVIAGGIVVRGDILATPGTNTLILAIGGLLASLIGTTGAAMVLIRPLLRTNSQRKHVVHTVVFFIFIVANIGGSLLPIGDPPLFLGYLRGVEFFWTLHLVREWAFMLGVLLVVYYLWDRRAYAQERQADLARDAAGVKPVSIVGLINILWLLGVVGAVITLDPQKQFPGTSWSPPPYLREGVQLAMVAISLLTTRAGLRKENQFTYAAIGEVACLFIGIFVTMQVPIEILNAQGAKLGLTQPWQFFWATGVLSSFLDNAPTYVVFFETAVSLNFEGIADAALVHLPSGRNLPHTLLVAISCGAVFMGANTYIGNGPNFMVKSIAEQSGVKMPSFFGYMLYSGAILIPLFVVMTLIFFR